MRSSVDRLRITGKTKLTGIIGYPISHSLSPLMQNAAFQALKMDFCYIPMGVHPHSLKEALAGLLSLGFKGLNVTVPHKKAVMKHLHHLSKEAKLIGAVNTIKVHRGQWIGHNTDGMGFSQAYRRKFRESLKSRRVLLLGAGGAARAVATQLMIEKVDRIVLTNRTPSRARSLERFLRKKNNRYKIETIEWRERLLRRTSNAVDLIINATSVGMGTGDDSPLPPGLVRPRHTVCDLVYRSRLTPLLRESKRSGARVMDGLEMLLDQGALSFKIWTGRIPPIRVMERAIRGVTG